MGAGVEADSTHEAGPFGPVWSRAAAVEKVGGDVCDLVAEGLEKSFARSVAEPSR
jgi:hypothetical protein